MKISYNWLKEYIDINHISPDKLATLLTDCGLEVEGYETKESIKGGLKGLVIGEVVSKEKHPDADRLSVTQVKINESEPLLHIVCGAPNVSAGQKVVVAPVGCVISPTNGEPFKIKKSKIRGQLSEGMICAEDEIGLGNSHDGVMVLDASAPVGELAMNYFKVETDTIFEIGLTPNRADATGHIGVARDIAAVLNQNTKTVSIQYPNVENVLPKNNDFPVKVTVEDQERCARYSSLTITGIKVTDSPNWLKNRLLSIGLAPINNVVDVTNFVMHELGQPLHAFDADKIAGKQIKVKTVNEGALFVTLDEVERKLSSEDLMICDNEKPLCIAGVFGGISSGISANTSCVFLESAYFSAVSVRKTAKRHGLNTDASFRYERGADPNITVYALKRAAQLITEIAGGKISSEINDVYPQPISNFEIDFSYANCDRLIGKRLDRALIKNILTSIGIVINEELEDHLKLQVPPFKVDVTREVDVIEEILRIYGYNNIELPKKLTTAIAHQPSPDKEKVINTISDLLVSKGFYEIFSNSLTKQRYYPEDKDLVEMINPLSNELGVMRKTLLFSSLETIVFNQNRKNSDLCLFEIGKIYHQKEGKFSESNQLSIVLTGKQFAESWNTTKNLTDFFQLRGVVNAVLERLGLDENQLQLTESSNNYFKYGLTYQLNNKELVEMGEVSTKLMKQFDIQHPVYYAQIEVDILLKYLKKLQVQYIQVNKFPSVRRDLSLLIPKKVSYESLKNAALKAERKHLKEVSLFDVYEGENIGSENKSYAISFIFEDTTKTLTDKEVDKMMQRLISTFSQEFNAQVR